MRFIVMFVSAVYVLFRIKMKRPQGRYRVPLLEMNFNLSPFKKT